MRRGRGGGRPPFGRRPFRRPFRPPLGAPRGVPPELVRANDLMSHGRYGEAARAFVRIAEGANVRGGLRAPIYHLRAGKGYFLAKDRQRGMQQLRRGLMLLTAQRAWGHLQRLGERTVNELDEMGYDAEAREIADFLAENLPDDFSSPDAEEKSRPQLPTNCLGCGAPLRSDEVVWIDEDTAECEFCGSVVRGES